MSLKTRLLTAEEVSTMNVRKSSALGEYVAKLTQLKDSKNQGEGILVTTETDKEMANDTRKFRAAAKKLGVMVQSFRQNKENTARVFKLMSNGTEEKK